MLPDAIIADPQWTDSTALYRYFKPDGLLLYVGISNQPLERHRGHVTGAVWFKAAEYRSVEWLPTRALAEWAETSVIAAEAPEFNIKRQPPTPFARLADRWFLDAVNGEARGQHKSWHQKPAKPAWRGDFEPCTEPAWSIQHSRSVPVPVRRTT